MKDSWLKKGNEWWINNSPTHYTLKNVHYVIKHKDNYGFYLLEKEEKFDFSYKIYDLENDFIDRVIKSYNSFNSNMGVILYGIKGTGKSITSKMICNKLNLPIIMIENNVKDLEGVEDFVNEIPQEFVLFIDEYEKKYTYNDDALLSIMDGSATSSYKRLFLFTTNSLYINDNLISRPGRIRYIKQYSSLDSKIIDEIIDDTLIYKNKKKDIISFCNTLNIVTVDILKAIINEVNLFNESPQEFESIFNISKSINKYDIYEINDSGDFSVLFRDVSCNIEECKYSFFFHDRDNLSNLSINDTSIGKIIKAINKDTFKLHLISNEDFDEDFDEKSNKNKIKSKLLQNKSEYKTLRFIKK